MTFSTRPCQNCDGSGWVRVASSWDEGDVVPDRCWECDGTGEYRVFDDDFYQDSDTDAQGALK